MSRLSMAALLSRLMLAGSPGPEWAVVALISPRRMGCLRERKMYLLQARSTCAGKCGIIIEIEIDRIEKGKKKRRGG